MSENSGNEARDLNLSTREEALAASVIELVRFARSQSSHSSPATARFALFSTAALVEAHPELREALGEETLALSKGDPEHLSSIELPTHHKEASKELAEATWPEDCTGGYIHATIRAAITNEPTDGDSPMFVAAAALNSGETFTAIDASGTGELRVGRNLIPELTAMLVHSLGVAPTAD